MTWDSGFWDEGRWDDEGYGSDRLVTFTEPAAATYQEGRMASSETWVYHATSELPSRAIHWKDRDGNTVDLSAASFVLKATPLEGGTTTTKTTGIIGSAANPNVIVTWSAGELAAIGVGSYVVTLDAVVSGDSRPYKPGASIRLIIKEPT